MTTVKENESKIVKEGEGETNLVMNNIAIGSIDLLELLEGAITHADKGKNALRALNSVQLLGGAGNLIARATDRYRLIEGKIAGEGHLDHTLIALDDIKRVIEVAKANKLSLFTLNRIGDLLTVSTNGSSLTLTVLDANYPNTFGDLFTKGEVTAIETIAFNPAFFADYAKIVGKGVQVSVTFKGERMPMVIGLIGDKVEWRALLMPMRLSN
jgi:DNA polymerase III sliding clamp (beta) subunit (PCNA family)